MKKLLALLLATLLVVSLVACSAPAQDENKEHAPVAPPTTPVTPNPDSDPVTPPSTPDSPNPIPVTPPSTPDVPSTPDTPDTPTPPPAPAPAPSASAITMNFGRIDSEINHLDPVNFGVYLHNLPESAAANLSFDITSSAPDVFEVGGWQPIGFITEGVYQFEVQCKGWSNGTATLTATIPELNLTISHQVTIKEI